MKKLIVVLLLVAMSSASFSQSSQPSTSLTAKDYLKKSRGFKTAAWVSIGSGVVLASTGIIVALVDASRHALTWWQSPDQPGNQNYNAGSGIFITGCVLMVASIPLFIIASKDKQKARSLSFNNEMIQHFQNGSLVNSPVPSLSLRISL